MPFASLNTVGCSTFLLLNKTVTVCHALTSTLLTNHPCGTFMSYADQSAQWPIVMLLFWTGAAGVYSSAFYMVTIPPKHYAINAYCIFVMQLLMYIYLCLTTIFNMHMLLFNIAL